MPSYFFDVNGSGVPDSDEGQTLANDADAWHEATLVAARFSSQLMGSLSPGKNGNLRCRTTSAARSFLST